jgi:GAF domain-containing protein
MSAEGAGVNGAAVPEKLLASVVRSAARLCGAPLSSVALPTPAGEHLEVLSVFGTGGLIVEKRLPLAESLNGMVLTSGHSFRSPDVWSDQRSVIRDIARRNRVRGVLIVPLVTRERVVGTLAVARRAPWEFSSQDERHLEALADGVALPVEGIRLERSPGQPEAAPVSYHLTPRERDVLRLLLADCTCRQVAAALGLSDHTVRHYVERLKIRLHKATLHGLLAFALQNRLIG